MCSMQGRVVGVEIKAEGEQLTRAERIFWFEHGDMLPLFILRTVDDVLQMTHRVRDEEAR
jgi:hypothetical protein